MRGAMPTPKTIGRAEIDGGPEFDDQFDDPEFDETALDAAAHLGAPMGKEARPEHEARLKEIAEVKGPRPAPQARPRKPPLDPIDKIERHSAFRADIVADVVSRGAESVRSQDAPDDPDKDLDELMVRATTPLVAKTSATSMRKTDVKPNARLLSYFIGEDGKLHIARADEAGSLTVIEPADARALLSFLTRIQSLLGAPCQ